MVCALLPVVGVTLPLFSYGGSSVITSMICVGLLMNVSIRRFSY
jgi:rod shape determining protein RodA